MQRLFSLSFLLLFFFHCAMPAKSQTYTPEKAIALVHQLQTLKILSPLGEEILLTRIQHTGSKTASEFDENQRGLSKNGDWGNEELSNRSILIFLQEAFRREQSYRMGPVTVMKLVTDANGKPGLKPEKPQNKAHAKGPELEALIPTEDTFPEQAGFTTYGPPAGTERGEWGWIHPTRSALGKTRSRTVRDLQSAGLIDSAIAEMLLPQIKNNTLLWEWSVLEKAVSLQGFRDDYAGNKAAELATAQRLVAAGVMTAANYARLAASYKPYELKEKRGLLPFCEHTLIFKSAGLPAELHPFFDAVFAQVRAQLLPQFNYRNLEAPVYHDTTREDLRRRNYSVRFEVDGKLFQHEGPYDYAGLKHHYSTELPINAGITKAVNGWLAQQGAPQRLYFANFPDSINIGEGREQFALLLLTQAQFKAWQSSRDDHFISEEVYEAAFTDEKIGDQVGLYSVLGLFNHLSDSEKRAGFAKTRTTVIQDYGDLLACFPKTIVVFDVETGNLENPYEAITNELAAASRGAFRPTNIKDDFGKNLDRADQTEFSFDFGGKHYATHLQMEGDWLDGAFMKLLESALAENKVEGKWHYCLDHGQEVGYIFLTPQQYAALKAAQPKLFPNG